MKRPITFDSSCEAKESTLAAKIIAQIKRHEGSVFRNGRHRVYTCPTGHPTIGYGCNLDTADIAASQRREWERHGMSDIEADALLWKQLGETEYALNKARSSKTYWTKISPVRHAVLLNMAFNIGIAGLQKFSKMWAAIEAGDHDKAAAEMLDSRWRTQVGSRADELADQMRTGKWASPPAKPKQKGSVVWEFAAWIAIGAVAIAVSHFLH